MKSNLFKKIGAMATTVAMVASLGTVAFADASISIGDATVGAADTNGVRTVTVPYTATGVTGEVAVLGYVAKNGAGTSTYAAYAEGTHTIVGIEQEAVKTTGETNIIFKVKDSSGSTEQSNINGKDYLYITLGAQDVNTAATKVVSLVSSPPATTWTANTAAWKDSTALSAELANGATAEQKAAKALELIKAATVTVGDGTHSKDIRLDQFAAGSITIEPGAVDGNSHPFTINFTKDADTGVDDSDLSIILGTVADLTRSVTITEAAAPVSPDNYVTIGSGAKAEWDSENEVFNVTVPYTTTNAKTNAEVAMMAYIGRKSSFTTDTTQNYTNETDMRIIGIAQQTNGTTGGTFTYKVTGDVGENTYMVVKVGAQGENVAPDMVALSLSKPAAVTNIDALYATLADLTDLADDRAATIKAALAGKTATIYAGESSPYTAVATYVLTGTEKIYEFVKTASVNGVSYKYYAVIPTGTDVTEIGENTNVIIPNANDLGGIKAYFNVSVAVPKWTAAKGSMAGVSVEVAEGADDTAILAAVKAAIVGKDITLADAASTAANSAKVTILDAWHVEKVNDTTYKVTVPANSTLKDVAPAGAQVTQGELAVEFGVTVTTPATSSFTIDSFKAYDSDNAEVTEIEVENGTTEVDAKAAIAAKVAKVLALGDGGKSEAWTATEWTIADYNATTAGSYTATATLQAPADAKGQNTNSKTLTVTVKVKASTSTEKYRLGDVNGNGSIDHSDWQIILNHLTESRVNNDLKPENNTTTKTEAWMSADADGNGSIGHSDWQIILNHLTESRINNDLGKEFNVSEYGK